MEVSSSLSCSTVGLYCARDGEDGLVAELKSDDDEHACCERSRRATGEGRGEWDAERGR